MNKVYDEVEDAIRVETCLADFQGSVQKWKLCLYEVWRYEMTWGFAYDIRVIDRRSGVWLSILAKPVYKDTLIETLEDLGYRKCKCYAARVGVIYGLEHEELDEIEDVCVVYH